MMQRRTEPDRAALALRPLALAYRLIAVVLIATGLTRLIGVFDSAPEWNTLLYYTGMSNLLCLVWMVLLLVRTVADLRRSGIRGTSTPSARLSGAVMMAITVTMLIYLIVLVPDRLGNTGEDAPFTLTDNLVHIITPCLIIGDWLFFVAKGSFRWRDPLLWAITPYAYLVFAFTFSALGGEFKPGQKYPYPFMNLDALGLGGVATWIAALTVALIAVGYVYVVLDRLLGSLGTRRGH